MNQPFTITVARSLGVEGHGVSQQHMGDLWALGDNRESLM